ncbi:endoflagellar protein [Alkalibaculum sp. M08DMB]|uniref:Endoflagellar protein n=1 Tax=Alkalibaculum sporogenes TaxID=2655001 RepID=A0A6A7K5V8_9FIRM|nr:flagellar FlbD family protein [Alkalibaculum sporogenes]MPW24800.1 endoflagellar protein [Alkalibaculum sporogenes]
MILLTSINGKEFCLNSELIYKIEEAADTIITLTDGKILRVEDTIEDIVPKIIKFKRQIHNDLPEGIK